MAQLPIKLSVRALKLGIAFTSCCFAQSDEPSDPALDLMRAVQSHREALPPCELEFAVEVLQHRGEAKLGDCKYRYHAWWDFADGRVRVESSQDCPNLPVEKVFRRFAYSDGTYLVVPDDSLSGEERHGKSTDFMRDPHSLTVYQLSADPRIVGVLPARYAVLKHYSVQDISNVYLTSSSATISNETSSAGKSLIKVAFRGYKGAKCNVSYWLDPEIRSMPVRIYAETELPSDTLVTEVLTDWQTFPTLDPAHGVEHALPIRSEFKQSIRAGVQIHEIYSLKNAKLGPKPADALFQWKSMKLNDNFVVQEFREDSTTVKQWDAATGSFGPWKPVDFVDSSTEMPIVEAEQSSGRRLIVGVNLIGAFLILAYLGISAIRRRRRDAV